MGRARVPIVRDVSAAEEPRYDPFASWYHDWVPAPDADLVARSLLGLTGAVTGQRILDLGCGEGRIARLLAGHGNDVVGVDLSGRLLEIARRGSDPRITYLQGSSTDPGVVVP